jgi:hypothetical protein
MLARTTLEALVNMRGYIKTLGNQGVKLTALFHPDLISYLEKMKIFVLAVRISHYIYIDPNDMSFANSVFTPFCVNRILRVALSPSLPWCELSISWVR